MSNATKRRCGQCGERVVVKLARPGRTAAYRSLELAVPASLEIPTCENCGAEWIDLQTARALDEALEPVYQEIQRARLDRALDKILSVEDNQTRIERALAISPGYLSKLKHGKRAPSGEIVSLLTLVSDDPEHALERLETLSKRDAGGRKRTAS